MNAIYLHLPDGTPTKWSMCSECKAVAAPGNFDVSQKCCTCYDCGLPTSPEERKARSLYHRDCERKRRSIAEMAALEKAEMVVDYDGPVYYEGVSGGWGDGYFADVFDLVESLEGQEVSEWPEHVFCCRLIPFRGVSADDMIESACGDMDDEASERLNGEDKLRAACAAFNEANKEVVSWTEDRKRKVKVPR